MPLTKEVKSEVYKYCKNHLPDDYWYENEIDFIEDTNLQKRIIEEFKGIRFAYKLYEGLEAKNENLIFQIRHQILSYATIYEAIIHYVLYTYYSDTKEFHDLQYHTCPAKICIPMDQLNKLNQELVHNGDTIIPYHMQERKKDETQVRFDDKCKTAEALGLMHDIKLANGTIVNLTKDIIEIYSYRNAIHLIAEQRKGITYELELSEKAYKRMKPFIAQIKEKLKADKKGIYK